MQPEDNLISKQINSTFQETIFKYLSEIILKLFNSEGKK
jgi:hypothetical protein